MAVNPHPGEGSRTRELFYLDPLYPVARLAVALWVPLPYVANDFHTIDDLPEDRMLVIQPRRRHVRDKELRPAGIRARVRHREYARPVVTQLGMELVRDPVPRPAVPRPRRVPALDHKVRYNAVKGRPIEIPLARQEDEVVDGLRHLLGEELHLHRTLLGNEVGVVLVARLECHLRRSLVRFVCHRDPLPWFSS